MPQDPYLQEWPINHPLPFQELEGQVYRMEDTISMINSSDFLNRRFGLSLSPIQHLQDISDTTDDEESEPPELISLAEDNDPVSDDIQNLRRRNA